MGGMRRLLKKLPPVSKYIRLAVDSGIYRDMDNDGTPQYLLTRQSRNDGREIEDYPVEYQILTLYPPYPDPPRIPEAYRRKMERAQKPHETQKLMNKRLQILNKAEAAASKIVPLTEAEYYERLLGVPAPPRASGLGMKAAKVQQAYSFAIKQWQIMREDGVTEAESLTMVNALLKKEETEDKKRSREMVKDLQTWRSTRTNHKTNYQALPMGTVERKQAEQLLNKSTNPTIFYNKERTIGAMTMWSHRLRAIPYVEWTIGASVALDHWVARSVLNLTEETWQTLLEGNDPNLSSRGLDIIHARQALFPETILGVGNDHYDDEYNNDGDDDDMFVDEKSVSDQTIDDLLAKLGMTDDDDTDSGKAWQNSNVDEKVAKFVEQLQDWREKNAKVSYDMWNTSDKGQFDVSDSLFNILFGCFQGCTECSQLKHSLSLS